MTTALAIIMLVGMLAAAGAGVASDAINYKTQQTINSANQEIADRDREWNAQQAEINRQFQADQTTVANERNVYNAQHSYQWATQDLQAAGLNPALAMVNGGATVNSAAAASGAQASASHPKMDAPSIKATAGALAQANWICSALAMRAYGSNNSRPIGFGR